MIAETKVGEDELMDDLVDSHTTGNIIFVYHKTFKVKNLKLIFEYKKTFKICYFIFKKLH